jgi:quinol monooxygenase YgiN
MSPLPEDKSVTVVVRRRTKPGCELPFEEAIRCFIGFALSAPGNRGIQVLRSDEGNPREYTIVDRFADAPARRAFTGSGAYREWMTRLREFTENDPHLGEMEGLAAAAAEAEDGAACLPGHLSAHPVLAIDHRESTARVASAAAGCGVHRPDRRAADLGRDAGSNKTTARLAVEGRCLSGSTTSGSAPPVGESLAILGSDSALDLTKSAATVVSNGAAPWNGSILLECRLLFLQAQERVHVLVAPRQHVLADHVLDLLHHAGVEERFLILPHAVFLAGLKHGQGGR